MGQGSCVGEFEELEAGGIQDAVLEEARRSMVTLVFPHRSTLGAEGQLSERPAHHAHGGVLGVEPGSTDRRVLNGKQKGF